VEANRPTFLTVSAANEKRVELVKVALHPPRGVELGEAARAPAGWTVQRSGDTVTWAGGSVAPGQFEQFGFEVEGVPKEGLYEFEVTLSFRDGSSEQAAAALTVVATGGLGGPVVTAGTVTSTSTTSAPTSAPTGDGGSGDDDTIALALAGAALVLSLVALAVGAARRRGGAPPASQDW
jgi:hypothetical protein